MNVGARLIVAAVLVCVCAGCGARSHTVPSDTSPPSDGDPLESFNRKIFWFNDKVDTYVLVPVAKGWDKIMPTRVKGSIGNFFLNLRFPIVAGNDLLQGKLKSTAEDLGRFAVNTTVGVLGFFDPATGWGLEQHYEDFGQTLGYWGLPPGPYLVLPFLGPSSPRDTVGFIGDSFSRVYPFFIDFIYVVAGDALNIVNGRAVSLKEVEQIKEASLDYYVAVRNAWVQHRDQLVHDRGGMSEQQKQELYETDY